MASSTPPTLKPIIHVKAPYHETVQEVVNLGPLRCSILEDGSNLDARMAVISLHFPAGHKGPALNWNEMHDESFYITSGSMRFTFGPYTSADEGKQEIVDVTTGDLITVPPRCVFTFENVTEKAATIFFMMTPGLFVNYFRAQRDLPPTATPEQRRAVSDSYAMRFARSADQSESYFPVNPNKASIVRVSGPDKNELEALPVGPIKITVLEDGSTTQNRLGIVVVDLPPHTKGPLQHWHEMHDETFLVTKGSVRFWTEGKYLDVDEGGYVVVPIRASHTFENVTGGEAQFMNTLTPAFYVNYFRLLKDMAEGNQGKLTPALNEEAMERFATVQIDGFGLVDGSRA
ncbi:hypothetical protein MMC25_001760 [Agyrium rufum]|nr:hypothetical protein [Agyrium rufum]